MQFLSVLIACDGSCRIAVLTSFAPIHSLALNVAGDVADVSVLIPPATGPHDYSFSPNDLAKIARADVLIINGVGLESWLDKGIRTSAKQQLRLVDSSRGINLITGIEMRNLPGVK